MLDLVCKNVIDEKLGANITKWVDTTAAADGIPGRMLNSSSFLEPIATLETCKTDTAMENKKAEVALPSKKAPVAVMDAYDDVFDSFPIGSDSASNMKHCGKLPKLCSKGLQSKGNRERW